MTYSLGIHVGHDSACALAKDGVIVSAIQQERITRRKHDGHEALTNRLPVVACLAGAGIDLDQVDTITTSFQAASPGGFGLHQPLVAPDFSLFNPFDSRHHVISHHMAHAWCAFGTSLFPEAAVLICDLGGTSSLDGEDFDLPFAAWLDRMSSFDRALSVRTEILSIYRASRREMELVDREFAVPHNSAGTFVHSLPSLYENVTGFLFEESHACGQTMALAAFGRSGRVPPSRLVVIDEAGPALRFLNNWQATLAWRSDFQEQADLALAVQKATEAGIVAYARRAKRLTGARTLAVGGGLFLNIPGNSAVVASALFQHYHVPSAPHDAGIAIGCALQGHVRRLGALDIPRAVSSDRLGPVYPPERIVGALARFPHALKPVTRDVSPDEIARALADGAVIARWAGRSEFGPRALGGRSFLASPRAADAKARLNRIKGRQPWRPVAPIVPAEHVGDLFVGPLDSPYMSFTYTFADRVAESLPALGHPDGSTRAQTLKRADDPWLHELLLCVGALTGYPVLVNTSLNGPGEVMVETPEQAVDLFLRQADVDLLLLDTTLCRRVPVEHRPSPFTLSLSIAPSATLERVVDTQGERAYFRREAVVIPISGYVCDYLGAVAREMTPRLPPKSERQAVERELWRLADMGMVSINHEDTCG